MEKEDFFDVLHDILINLKEVWIEDGDEGYQVEADEAYDEGVHELIIKNLDDNQSKKESINYNQIGLENIHILNYEELVHNDSLLFLFSKNKQYYLVKACCELNFTKPHENKSGSFAMKSASIEKLVMNLPSNKKLMNFSQEDSQYLTVFLEKEQLETKLLDLTKPQEKQKPKLQSKL
jgi:hypothetical protein